MTSPTTHVSDYVAKRAGRYRELDGGSLQGLGIQYYADGRGAKEIGSSRHSPARIAQVLQNLSSTGLRLSLTEFAVNKGERERAADILEDTMRLVLPSPRTVASSSAATAVTIAWTRIAEPAASRWCGVSAHTG